MTLTERVRRLLSRSDDFADPGTPVDLVVVPIASGPMTVAALRSQGIDAVGYETFNVATSLLSDFRITVPRSQLPEARQLLVDMR